MVSVGHIVDVRQLWTSYAAEASLCTKYVGAQHLLRWACKHEISNLKNLFFIYNILKKVLFLAFTSYTFRINKFEGQLCFLWICTSSSSTTRLVPLTHMLLALLRAACKKDRQSSQKSQHAPPITIFGHLPPQLL